MKFLSVCSGIEAASVAWNPLGWKAVAFSEIEPFPCAVLAQHYPEVPNLGDMTNYESWPDYAIDLLCGGTPCQSFSVAGLRKGLADPRGNLMLTFGAIAAKYRPRWLVWENVPGVLSSNGGRDFGSFLGLLGLLGYGFAYRVLDAQYFGVAQRRRRVFVVGCLGNWQRAAAVLLERHSMQGHPAPRRQAREGVAASSASGPLVRGFRETGPGWWTEGVAGLRADPGGMPENIITQAFGGGNLAGPLDVATAQTAHPGGRYDFDSETFIAHSLRGEGFDASEDGTGRGTPLVPVAFNWQGGGTQTTLGYDPAVGTAGTLVKDQTQAVVFAPDVAATMVARSSRGGGQTNSPGHQADSELVAYTTKLHNTQSNNAGKIFEERATRLDANSPPPALLTAMQVRRLTPRECERLQGFPDDYTAITVRGRPAADGPRYKALGNSWAVPNVRWIGRRIAAVDAISALREAA